MHHEHTYNALYVVRVIVRVWVNPSLANNYYYRALLAHYNALCVCS